MNITGHYNSLAINMLPEQSGRKLLKAQRWAANISCAFFSVYAKTKGFSFFCAVTENEINEADKIFEREGYKLPEHFKQEMKVYERNTVRFIAYYKGTPVGTIGLADPAVINRPYELHGFNGEHRYFEIQRLIISKQYRAYSQLILLGLFKEMYMYSLRHSISSWISFGLQQLYRSLRRYDDNIHVMSVNSHQNKTRLAEYLFEQGIFDSCCIINVSDVSLAKIFFKYMRLPGRK